MKNEFDDDIIKLIATHKKEQEDGAVKMATIASLGLLTVFTAAVAIKCFGQDNNNKIHQTTSLFMLEFK